MSDLCPLARGVADALKTSALSSVEQVAAVAAIDVLCRNLHVDGVLLKGLKPWGRDATTIIVDNWAITDNPE